MSSTLIFRPTPKPDKDEWSFGLPIKAMVARRFYDHDGSLGGGKITVEPDHLDWFEGVLAALGSNVSADQRDRFEKVVETLRNGRSVDMWFEV